MKGKNKPKKSKGGSSSKRRRVGLSNATLKVLKSLRDIRPSSHGNLGVCSKGHKMHFGIRKHPMVENGKRLWEEAGIGRGGGVVRQPCCSVSVRRQR